MFQECKNNLKEWFKTMFILSSSSFMLRFVNMFNITTKVKVQKSKHVLRCMYYHNYDKVSVFSSPEHEVLMVSYCGQWLSVVRRRPSCVVRQHLMFTLYRPHL